MQIKKIDTCFLYVFMIKTIKIGLKMAKIAAGKAEFRVVKPRIFELPYCYFPTISSNFIR